MKNISQKLDSLEGFAVYGKGRYPLGVVSTTGDKQARLNKETLPDEIKTILVCIEDQRFYKHGAVDLYAIARACIANLRAGYIIQGASTITQQLARNLLKSRRRGFYNKIKETLEAFHLEQKCEKKEILDLYLANVFWGKRNYGIRTSSLEYFKKEPENLSLHEKILLIALLRGPNFYLSNCDKLSGRVRLITNILLNKRFLNELKAKQVVGKIISFDRSSSFDVFKSDAIPFLAKNINYNRNWISTYIDPEIQDLANRVIRDNRSTLSIIAIKKGKIVCAASSKGIQYPFTFRSNVGSTLKPFIYTILRQEGVCKDELFSTSSLPVGNWCIKEANPISQSFLTLDQALQVSNNNVFVNAVFKQGYEGVMQRLSRVLRKPRECFVPSTVLGATIGGLTLYDLVTSYYYFFRNYTSCPIKSECMDILNLVASKKLGDFDNDLYIKTGTTNGSRERFAIVGYSDILYGFLKQKEDDVDDSKDGDLLSDVLNFLKEVSEKEYNWDETVE